MQRGQRRFRRRHPGPELALAGGVLVVVFQPPGLLTQGTPQGQRNGPLACFGCQGFELPQAAQTHRVHQHFQGALHPLALLREGDGVLVKVRLAAQGLRQHQGPDVRQRQQQRSLLVAHQGDFHLTQRPEMSSGLHGAMQRPLQFNPALVIGCGRLVRGQFQQCGQGGSLAAVPGQAIAQAEAAGQRRVAAQVRRRLAQGVVTDQQACQRIVGQPCERRHLVARLPAAERETAQPFSLLPDQGRTG